jgi:H+-transporting ATPase
MREKAARAFGGRTLVGVLLAAIASAAALASSFAWAGWFMAALPGWLVLSLYGASLGYGLMLDMVKVAMLRWLPVDRR